MRNMIYSFIPKPVLMQNLVCAMFLEKDKGHLCSESGCSDIFNPILFTGVSHTNGTGDRVVPGGPPGNQAGPPATELVVST